MGYRDPTAFDPLPAPTAESGWSQALRRFRPADEGWRFFGGNQTRTSCADCLCGQRNEPDSLGIGDAQRMNPGHIRLLHGMESDNRRSEGDKHLSTSRYSSCQRDVSGTRTAWLVS